MWSVEVVHEVDGVSICNTFDFDSITQAYSFLWQHRHLWTDENFELILYRDSEIFCIYDDFSDNH